MSVRKVTVKDVVSQSPRNSKKNQLGFILYVLNVVCMYNGSYFVS
jgi:hypothetical protein